MKSKTKWLTLMATLAVVFVLVLSLGLSSVFAWADDDDPETNDGTAGRFYTEYQSKEAAYAATEDMNLSLEEEGIVMLKNEDDTLPLNGGAKVSVFGIAQDSIVETDGTITDSLRNAGFKVNDVLEEFYLSDDAGDSSAGSETMPGSREISSISRFNDVGIVVFQRGGAGESGSVSSSGSTPNDDLYLGEDTGWTHEGATNKHGLQLTQSENDIIALAEQTCKEVVVLYAGEHVFEMADMQDDDNIGGILWIGRPGNGGMDAVGEVLAGTVNPSGKTVDEWTRDLTNDPTYANNSSFNYTTGSGEDSKNTGYSGLDYEEDIYLGYKYYETYWYEAKKQEQANAQSPTVSPKIYIGDTSNGNDDGYKSATADEWYEYNMLYPFGYGLSYTTFEYGDVTLTADAANSLTTVDSSLTLSNVYNSSTPSGAKSLTVTLDVTNTGDVAGREVVEVYVEAPYGVVAQGADSSLTGIEKPYITLAGYAKTDVIKPGKTKTVTVEMDLQDIASFDYDDANGDGKTGYTLDAGEYTVHVMESSSHLNITDDENAPYASETFNVASTIVLDLDTYSGKEVETWFSGSDGTESNGDEWKDDYDSLLLANESGTMTLLSRSDFDNTKPEAPTSAVLKSTGGALDVMDKYDVWDADTDSDEGEPWEKTVEDLSGWTQGAGVDADGDGLYDGLILDDMAGVPMDSSLWVTFMNQLTWEEMAAFLNDGMHQTLEISTIGKVKSRDDNGPNYINSAPTLVGAPTRSATWNTELAYQSGIVNGNAALAQNMTGWYGPGINMHRSPFGGRTTEYFSQDSIQGGLFASAMVKGMTDCGVNVYLKHLAMYDGSAGASTCVNASEQNMRENYLKIFQICMQEGHATATMTSYNRIAAFHPAGNYALIEGLLRSEWGWTGFCLTDNTNNGISADWLVRGGHNLYDGTWGASTGISGTWDKDYAWTDETSDISDDSFVAPEGAVIVGEGENAYASATQWYCTRIAVQRILYNICNSAANNNGITVQDAETYTLNVTLAQGETASGIDVVSEDILERGYTITGLEVTDGALPEGLSIDDGQLGGKVYGVAGNYSVLMTVYVDGWVQLTTQINISVVSALEMEFDVSEVSKNESMDVYVLVSDAVADSDSFSGKTITYAVTDGELPIGLQLDEATGRITGEPIVSGDYTFTITATVVGEGWVADFTDYQWSVYQMQVSMHRDLGYDDINVFIDALEAGEVFVGSTPGEEYWPSDSYHRAEDESYYLTYTISVSDNGSSSSGVTSDELDKAVQEAVDAALADSESGSSGGNGMAITGLVLGIVAIVLAAAVLVIVLLRRNNGGSSKDDSN